jgi:NTE family protein
MLQELFHRGIHADRVYGASVGAVNAAAYCGDPSEEGLAHLEHIWLGLSGNDVFPRGRRYGPWRFLQQRQSVHPNDGLRNIIESGLRFENLEDATIPLSVVATSLTGGKERWLTSGPALQAVLASSAIPALLPPVAIDGEIFVDGGVVNNVPIKRAIEDGAKQIYVLLCGPLDFRPPIPKRPVEAILVAFFVAIHARFIRELETIPKGVAITVFTPGGDPATDYQDFSESAQLIALGRQSVIDMV